MTLERLTERLEEEHARIGSIDGRRFNSRSRTKMSWEMKNISKSIVAENRRRSYGGNRSIFTKDELREYKEIEDKFRKEQIKSRKLAQKKTDDQDEVDDKVKAKAKSVESTSVII